LDLEASGKATFATDDHHVVSPDVEQQNFSGFSSPDLFIGHEKILVARRLEQGF
jgi:hypothetical protein